MNPLEPPAPPPGRRPVQALGTGRLRRAGCTTETIDRLQQLCHEWAQRPGPSRYTVNERKARVAKIHAKAVELQAELSKLTGSEFLNVVVWSGVDRGNWIQHLVEACEASLQSLDSEAPQKNRPDGNYLPAFVAFVAELVEADGISVVTNPASPFMNIVDECMCAAGLVGPAGDPMPADHVVRALVAQRRKSQL